MFLQFFSYMHIYTSAIKVIRPAMTTPAIPLPTLTAAPVNGVMGLETAVGTCLTDAKVVAPAGPDPAAAAAPYPAAAAVGDATTGAGLPAARPALGALEAPIGELPVVM